MPAVALALAVLFLSEGCAVRPRTSVPRDMTVEDILGLLDARTASMVDFTGNALVVTKSAQGASTSIRLSIRYLSPDRYRITAKAFAGIVVALVTADSDTVTVFFPSDNAYITLGRHDDVVRFLVPGIIGDIDRFTGVVNGFIPPRDKRDGFKTTLEHRGGRTIVALDDGFTKHTVTVEGRECRVVAASIERAGAVSLNMRASRFDSKSAIPFPGRVVMDNERGSVDIGFSDCAFNGGLRETDVGFTIPSGAERLGVADILRLL